MRTAIRELAARVGDARASLPALRGRTDLVLLWLKTAKRAQIALAASVLALFFVLPPVRDAILETIFPTVTARGGFLGLGRRRRVDPNFEIAQTIVTAVAWAGAAGGVGILFLLHLPVVLAKGAPLGSARTVHASARTSAPPALAPGEKAGGRYRIDAELGRGAMGVVYRAHDEVLDRDVALKELPPTLAAEPSLVERFRTEARALARLTHPHIVQVYDLVEDGGRLFMAMELVAGGDLSQLLDAKKRLDAREAVRLGRQMAEALAYAHERGVFHRDFKPMNVLVTPEGAAKITDFGLAKLAQGPKLTQVGAIMGSPAYMSPEQAKGLEADGRADVYALGVTLFEMLTGRLPFQGEVLVILAAHVGTPPPPPSQIVPDVPPALDTLVVEMMEKDPARRSAMSAIAARLAPLDQAPPPDPSVGR